MEEADALATRAAIISKRLLAIGSTQALRDKYSNVYHVSLILQTAPLSTEEEMRRLEDWVRAAIGSERGGVVFDGQSLGGQVRFAVPAGAGNAEEEEAEEEEADADDIRPGPARRGTENREESAIGSLIEKLEANKEALGLEFYSVGGATLERVFMNVVKENNVVEKDEGPGRRRWQPW